MPKKKYDDDDGRTIVNMNCEGFPWYVKNKSDKPVDEKDKLTSKEMRAIIKGAYRAYLPAFLFIIGGFTLAFLLICIILGRSPF
ncbi:MAG: hypothetical protein IJU83_03335 [Clostridia bacterium]|nr:hypothetical protein [Clostridia bacterium]